MADSQLKSVTKALHLFDLVVQFGLDGAPLAELAKKVDMPKSSVHRRLEALEQAGWLTKEGSKQFMVWKPSNKLLTLAHEHRNAVINRTNQLKRDFKLISGQEI